MTVISGLSKKLIEKEILPEEKLLEAQEKADNDKIGLVRYLVIHQILESPIIAKLASFEFGIPFFDLASFNIEYIPNISIKSEAITRGEAVPLFLRGNRLYVALSDPSNLQVLDDLKFQTNTTPEPIIVEDKKLQQFVSNIESKQQLNNLGDLDDESLDNINVDASDDGGSDDGDMGGSEDTPVVRFVYKVLLDAIESGASDIHFEPYEKNYRVRFRQDGVLFEYAAPPNALAGRLSTRLKVMSQLDISERRVPQDGRFKMRISKQKAIDFRISTCPTLFGEKVVMRILDPTSAQIGIDALGYEAAQKDLFMTNIHKPQGMVLVTGPTGSGKTVSLYTALNILNTVERNISTAEDPVEINLSGINQVNVNAKAGLTFSAALRSFLRQDPDIVMVGEIRDLETAEIAIKAAQTGHLVLSTLHTNSAPDTLARLVNMGVPAFNLATSVNLIIAQRLARRLCPKCKQAIDVPEHALEEIGFTQEEIDSGELKIYEPTGCGACSSGYKGRVGVYEVMEITKGISQIIMNGGNALEIEKQARSEGVWGLRESGLNKVKQGLTTIEEINRITKE